MLYTLNAVEIMKVAGDQFTPRLHMVQSSAEDSLIHEGYILMFPVDA